MLNYRNIGYIQNMKKSLLLLIFCNLLSLPSYGFALKNAVHTTARDIELKKAKALQWYENNVDKGKFYFYDAAKQIDWLKNRSLRWYEANITNGKFYFVHSDVELSFTKNKALRWYEKNSQ